MAITKSMARNLLLLITTLLSPFIRQSQWLFQHPRLISSVTPLPLQQAVRTWPVPKELIRAVTKVVAGIAAVVFILARFTTTTGVLLFAGSVVVLFEPAVVATLKTQKVINC